MTKLQKWEYYERMETFLICASMASGLGNFWRLPYTLYLHNGGSFLYQYFILYFFVGLPMLTLNFDIGQFSAKITYDLWSDLGRGWRGVGITQCFLAFVCLCCYGLHATLALRYACNAWRYKFAWGVCEEHGVSQPDCVPLYEDDRKKAQIDYTVNLSSSAESFLARHFLQTQEHLMNAELGSPNFELCFYLCLIWILYYLNATMGIRKYTKLCYFTGICPYIAISIFCMRVLLLPGAFDGVLQLFTPTLNGFLEVDNWIGALMQCFYTLNIPCGSITVISTIKKYPFSGNKFITIIIVFNVILTLFTSVSVYSVMGFLSQIQKLPIHQVYKTYKYWNAYISYTAGLVFIRPASNYFAFFFFISVYLSTFFEMTSLILILLSNIHKFTHIHKSRVLTLICLICPLISIAFTTPEGTILSTYVDLYGNTYIRAIIIPVQLIVICYSYSLRSWCWDYLYMRRYNMNYFYKWMWAIFIPIILLVIYILSEFSRAGALYNLNLLPYEARIVCFVMLILITLPIPFVLIYELIVNCGGGFKLSWERTFCSDLWWPYFEVEGNPAIIFRERKLTFVKERLRRGKTNVFIRFVQALVEKNP